jgi:hypothetical protein
VCLERTDEKVGNTFSVDNPAVGWGVAIVYAYLYDQLSFMRQESFFQRQTREKERKRCYERELVPTMTIEVDGAVGGGYPFIKAGSGRKSTSV